MMPKNIKTVVVLSLPRSGSSLLAGILCRLGVYMGSNQGLSNGSHVNKYGNYENQEFFKLSLKILHRSESFSLSWADIPNKEKVKKAVKYFFPFLELAVRKNERDLWGWKDGTSIHTIRYFDKCLINPHYIALKRDVESMVKSHLKAAKISDWYKTIFYISKYFTLKELVHIAWRISKKMLSKGNIFNDEERYRAVILEGFSRMDRFIKNKKHLSINFLDLIENPQEVINRIVIFLNINPSDTHLRKAIRFIDLDEVHFQKKNN